MPTTGFADRLIKSIRAAGAPTCIGLDPVLERLPDAVRSVHPRPIDAIAAFCTGVLDAAQGHAAAVKFQSACFERYGGAGVAVLGDLMAAAASRGWTVILDAKRGDIGISAEHYAAAVRSGAPVEGTAGAHAITVNGYLGPATIEPYMKAGLGVFVLVRTSNPDSDIVQSARLEDGRTVAEMMADHVATLGQGWMGQHGYSDVGAVVGATKAADSRALRERMPKQFFLVPGYGAQGGTADDIRALLDGRHETGGGVLVTASRSVIYAFEQGDGAWEKAITRAAIAFATEVSSVVG
jgi:orotidine-5'-phosphate decarboxylase